MRGARTLIAFLVVAGVAACGGSENGEREGDRADASGEEEVAAAAPRVSGAPEVEESYQARIDEAWQEAVAGENPSITCAAVKGRATASEPGSAARAIEACNVDVPVRYFLTYVERIEAGEKTCNDLMMEVMTKLPAMTISTEGFRELARRGDEADTSDAAAVGAGAAILAGEAAAGGGVNDPRQVIKDRLRDRVTAVCPNEASIILR